MPIAEDQYLQCGDCAAEMALDDALGAAFKAWSSQSWIAFRCPKCGTQTTFKLLDYAKSPGNLR
jgi:hypothetical protein